MLPQDRLDQITRRFEFLEARLNAGPPADEIAAISREYAELTPVVAGIAELREAQAALADLTIREGKNVLEFAVRSTTKGEAVEHLRRYTRADAVFYEGDDVTDEDAFDALGPDDLGVKSGEGATLAAHRVAGPEQVAHVLSLLATFREGDIHEQ